MSATIPVVIMLIAFGLAVVAGALGAYWRQ